MLDGLAGSGGVVGGGMAAGGVVTGSGGNVVDMLEIPGKGIYSNYNKFLLDIE